MARPPGLVPLVETIWGRAQGGTILGFRDEPAAYPIDNIARNSVAFEIFFNIASVHVDLIQLEQVPWKPENFVLPFCMLW